MRFTLSIRLPPRLWDWANEDPTTGDAATLSISSSGPYTLSVWPREDGLRLDRLLLTTDTTYLPTASGPPESLRRRIINYSYDGLDRLSTAGYSTGEAFTYTYDALGNRLGLLEVTSLSGTVVTSHTFDAANRLTERQVSDGRTYTYTWSARGELLAEWTQGSAVRTFTYDGAGYLTEATLFTLTTVYTYNGDGARTVLAVAGYSTTTYLLDTMAGDRILRETTAEGATDYLYGHLCLAEVRQADWAYYLPDLSGYVRHLADEAGAITSHWLYNPDGVVLAGPEGPVSHLTCGGVYDWSTGLIYQGKRYFDPGLGIWLAMMPLVVVQLWSRSRRKRPGFPWQSLMLVLFVGGWLGGCAKPYGMDLPEVNPCTELIPFGPPLNENAVFVTTSEGGIDDGPVTGTMRWLDSNQMRTIENGMKIVMEDKFGGSDGFGNFDKALIELGVSPDDPIKLYRQHRHPEGAQASAGKPRVTIFDSFFEPPAADSFDLQASLLGHEMAHYWEQAEKARGNGKLLSNEMAEWINWGDTPTNYNTDEGENFAEAVRMYFWPKLDIYNLRWTDDDGAGKTWADKEGVSKDELRLHPDQLKLPNIADRRAYGTGPIPVQDRHDWLEMTFAGKRE